MKQERIAVEFAGISMKTPVMGASGTFGFGIEYSDFLDIDTIGAGLAIATTAGVAVHGAMSVIQKKKRQESENDGEQVDK